MGNVKRAALRAGSVALLAGAALTAAACGSSSSSSSASSGGYGSAPSSSASSAPAKGVSITAVKGTHGIYLAGASGRALYLWAADSGGKSSCSGACTSVWTPVITTATPVAAGAVKAAALSTITRSDGSKQVTYNGHPLYYYTADAGAGTTKGQGTNSFGAKWWLVAPSGAAITVVSTQTAPSSSGASSSSSSNGSGWG
jgi:predicted lipoprotein with Yx(FWY)xxD motif